MLKWIGGCFVLVVVCVVALVYYGYRKLDTYASAGAGATATIAGAPDRVFAAIADVDSLTEWRAEGLGIKSSRKGQFEVGDTIEEQMRSGAENRRTTWVVADIQPGKLLVTEMKSDTGDHLLIVRRDSLTPKGDSTVIASTIASPMFDTLAATRKDSSRTSQAAISVAQKFMIAAMRAQSTMELTRLKRHIERGDSLARLNPTPPPAPPKRTKKSGAKTKSKTKGP